MSIFKAYDIRGIYNKGLTDLVARRIGYFFSRVIPSKNVVVGHDMRDSSKSLKRNLIEGLTLSGVNVTEIGLISTPMINFAVANYGFDAGITITASHNPAQYNGFKVCRKNAVPVGYETGLAELEKLVNDDTNLVKPDAKTRSIERMEIMSDYIEHVMKFSENISREFHIAIDTGNGMAGLTLPIILDRLKIRTERLFFELDGTFPNHEANPLKEENIADLKRTVIDSGADFGIAFDGDADRIMFVDETGKPVAADIVTAMLAEYFLSRYPGSGIVYDVRSSRIVKETVEQSGGIPMVSKVGHAYMKKVLRDEDGVFGGELSGHYYYRDNFYTDSGVITLLLVLNVLSERGGKFSEHIGRFLKYNRSGELNFKIEDKDAMIEKISRAFPEGKQSLLDGLTVEFDKWWFNLRKSNTEPLLRLNVETLTGEMMNEKLARLTGLLEEK